MADELLLAEDKDYDFENRNRLFDEDDEESENAFDPKWRENYEKKIMSEDWLFGKESPSKEGDLKETDYKTFQLLKEKRDQRDGKCC